MVAMPHANHLRPRRPYCNRPNKMRHLFFYLTLSVCTLMQSVTMTAGTVERVKLGRAKLNFNADWRLCVGDYPEAVQTEYIDLLHIHHKAVQVLICVSGRGWYQEWGKEAVELKPEVVIAIPAEVKHWHGAAKDSWMQHLTYHRDVQEDSSNEWLEAVSDDVYNQNF